MDAWIMPETIIKAIAAKGIDQRDVESMRQDIPNRAYSQL
jgi:hypothetical protein